MRLSMGPAASSQPNIPIFARYNIIRWRSFRAARTHAEGGTDVSGIAGKVTIVVGAAAPGNMGQGLARRFAAAGAKVIVSGRKREPLDELAREIGADYQLC